MPLDHYAHGPLSATGLINRIELDEMDIDPPVSQIKHSQRSSAEEMESEVPLDSLVNQKAHPAHFKLLKVLGQGSFGKVFLVQKNEGSDRGKYFAMKVLKKAALKVRDRERTKLERNILAMVRHPFIVELYYAMQTEGKLYLVLEFVQGGDLFTRLSKEFMFTERDVQFYLAELATALFHIHSLGIIYRDLKPENVLVAKDGHIKLTDFGLSKESFEHAENENKAGSFCGTVEYMAPEVINRTGHDHVCDWWSFAVLMFEMLTGSLPFRDKNRKVTMLMICKEKLAMPAFLTAEAQSLLRRLFKRKPQNRLGAGPEGQNNIKRHEFFTGIDWNKLVRKEIKPPFIPTIDRNDHCGTDYFDKDFTRRVAQDSPAVPASAKVLNNKDGTIRAGANQLFRGFSFTRGSHERNPASSGNQELTESQFRSDAPEGFFLTNNESQNKTFHTEYDLLDVIGKGSFSEVKKCRHKKTGKLYAVKILKKSESTHQIENGMRNDEIEILVRFSSHPNIITVKDVFVEKFESSSSVFLVTELMEGGEIFTKIQKQKAFSEREASAVMKTIVSTVAYLHENDIAHRDLKPSNILYADESGDPSTICLVDFGFAKQLRHENGMLMTPCYTKSYVAPEVFKRQEYDLSCDIWSIGCIMFTMLVGKTPFGILPTDSEEVVEQKLSSCELNFDDPKISVALSPQARSLLERLLSVDSKCRPTAKQILEDEWIKNCNRLPSKNIAALESPVDISKGVSSAIKVVSKSSRSSSKAGGISLQAPVSSGLFKRRLKNFGKNFPSSLKF